jgi:hypothetical protein
MPLNIPSRFAHKLSLLFRLLSRVFSDFLPSGLSKSTKAIWEASSSSNCVGSEAKGVAADLFFGFSFAFMIHPFWIIPQDIPTMFKLE